MQQKSIHYFALLVFALGAFCISCGQKIDKEVCAGGVLKEYSDNNIKAKVTEGCVKKFTENNKYLIDGSGDFTLSGDTLSSKSVKLTKGTVISKNGSFVVKQTDKVLKLRLISGSGEFEINGKTQPLAKDQLLQIGG
jgi:hypothetical protein